MKQYSVMQLMVALIIMAQASFSTTYYVGNEGDDNANGLTEAGAFATLSRVHSLTLKPGDQVLLKRGSVFNETLNVPNISGSSGNPIIYGAYGTGEAPIIDAQGSRDFCINISYQNLGYLRFDSLECRAAVVAGVFRNETGGSNITLNCLTVRNCLNHGISIRYPDLVTIEYCTVNNNGASPAPGNPAAHGIYLTLSNESLIQYCVVDSNYGAGIHAYLCLDQTIRYNTVGHNSRQGSYGIIIWTNSPSTVNCYYNYLYGNGNRALCVRDCAPGSTVNIYNNVVAGTTAGDGAYFTGNTGSTVVVKNNVFAFNSGGYDVEVSDAGGTYVFDYNLYYRASGTTVLSNGRAFANGDNSGIRSSALGTHSLSTDPLFLNVAVSPGVQSSSPCRDAGALIGIAADFFDSEVPYGATADIGAQEWGGIPGKTGVEQENFSVPADYTLSQNYPNPFNPSTTIEFSLPHAGHTTLKVYDTMGSEVATLVSAELGGGIYKYGWVASGKASGVYFYRIQSGSFTSVKRLVLVK